MNKAVDFRIDFQLGVAGTSANITSQNGVGAYNTSGKLGYTTGAIFHFALFNIISFTSGLSFNGRSFEVTTPSLLPAGTDTTNVVKNSNNYITSNYLDIPVYFSVGGMVSEKVGLWFDGGPYLGILLSKPNESTKAGIGYKNFDLGVSGTLTANYMFQYPFSIIFGTNFKLGGLNNLGSTPLVDKISTTSYSFFSGLRISF
jgi:hypothetical protein